MDKANIITESDKNKTVSESFNGYFYPESTPINSHSLSGSSQQDSILNSIIYF